MTVLRMLCACSGQPLDAGSIVDLEKVIVEYAWRELKRDSRWYNCLRRADFTVDVPWNFFEFDHKTTRFKMRSGYSEDGYRERKQVELFRTDFTNSTNKDQVYKLRTQRQTKAATTVCIQKGFTLKGNTNFKLKIPPEIGHFGVSASTDGYLRVCRPRGETFEDTFTWQVDSDVTVEPKHVTNARLLVTEDELVADFEVRTSMRMPTGECPVIVRRRTTKEIYAVLMISDLREVFADIECNILNITKPDSDSKKPRYAIEFTTTGILESVRWRNQKICLESRPIKDVPRAEKVPPIRAGTSTRVDEPIYTSSLITRVIEQATIESDDDSSSYREREAERTSSRVKKDLRFNIVPTVIKEPEADDTYETPEKVLSSLMREGIGMKVDRLSGQSGTKIMSREDDDLPPYLHEHQPPEAAAEAPPSQSPQRHLVKSRDYMLQHQQAISKSPTPAESNYISHVENIYFKKGDTAPTYRPLVRDITLIAEEPEKETAACMSKQSSMQSEEGTLDDATESLDSGDSRRVSKVTSV